MMYFKVRLIGCLSTVAITAMLVLGVALGCALMDRIGTAWACVVSSLAVAAVAAPSWLLVRRYFDNRPRLKWAFRYQRRRSQETALRSVAKRNGIMLAIAAPLLGLLSVAVADGLAERLVGLVGASIWLFCGLVAVRWSRTEAPWHVRHDLDDAIKRAEQTASHRTGSGELDGGNDTVRRLGLSRKFAGCARSCGRRCRFERRVSRSRPASGRL